MNTIVLSLLGIATLVGLAFSLTQFEYHREQKWKDRMTKFKQLLRTESR